ncbi:hypothetical protein N9X12_04895 [Alphaproteobacteria bacterium]|nr:hypothetical protein [Alphaproteobacteria bacterium]
MSKTVLFEVFELLKSQGLVSTENEFSKDWLARSESYVRGLRFHDAEPSIATMALLASKLQYYGERLIALETGRQKKLGNDFLKYSQACHTKINLRCNSLWMSVMNPPAPNFHHNF